MKRKTKIRLINSTCFGIAGISYIVAYILQFESRVQQDGWILALGILLLFMMPVVALDNRKEMNTTFTAVASIILVSVLDLFLAYIYSSIALIVFSITATIMLVMILILL